MTTMTRMQADSLAQERRNLISDLTSPVSEIGDWKLMKIQEFALLGKESPYNAEELHAKRQEARARINEIEKILAEAEITE